MAAQASMAASKIATTLPPPAPPVPSAIAGRTAHGETTAVAPSPPQGVEHDDPPVAAESKARRPWRGDAAAPAAREYDR